MSTHARRRLPAVPQLLARLALPLLLTALLVGVFPSATVSSFEAAVLPSAPATPAPAPSPRPTAPRADHVVVLGDSVAAGSECGCTPYATLLASGLARRTRGTVSLVNVGTRGLTSDGLLGQLGTASVRRTLRSATVVTVTVGANDFSEGSAGDSDCVSPDGCYAAPLAAMSAHVRTALAQIDALVPRRARVLVTGYWNVFLDGEVGRAQGAAYVAGSDALTRRVNSALQAEAAAAHDTYVDEYGPFESRPLASLTALLAPDGDHPSAAGHALIASLLLRALPQPPAR
ncbi:MAG: SGNH/GDSL hydrolase family protein [Nocardioidaceae bacterium]